MLIVIQKQKSTKKNSSLLDSVRLLNTLIVLGSVIKHAGSGESFITEQSTAAKASIFLCVL